MTITSTDHLLPIAGRSPLVIESGHGCYVFDSGGRRYLDAITGIGVNALGHAHPLITAALAHQAGRSIHTSNLFGHPFQAELAARLCMMAGLDRAFFTSSGTEAVETALKAARARGRAMAPGKIGLVALNNSFHGRTFGSLAVTGQPKYRAPFEPLSPEVVFVEPNDCRRLEAAITERTAGVILEPILGEGGIIPLELEFLRLARELATGADALLIADEIQCGLGRTGRRFAYEQAEIQPDIVVLAKPLAAGLPLGATLFTEEAAAALPPGTHGTTFGGGPLACRVALEFLDVMDGFLPNVRHVGRQLFDGLLEQRARHSVIAEVRGRGLMIGIQLNRPGAPLVERAQQLGLLINCTHEAVLRLLPPYVLSSDQAEEVLEILDRVFSESA